MNIKVLNAGNCVICGNQINLIVSRGNSKLPNIFFCQRCEKLRVKKDKTHAESEEDNV